MLFPQFKFLSKGHFTEAIIKFSLLYVSALQNLMRKITPVFASWQLQMLEFFTRQFFYLQNKECPFFKIYYYENFHFAIVKSSRICQKLRTFEDINTFFSGIFESLRIFIPPIRDLSKSGTFLSDTLYFVSEIFSTYGKIRKITFSDRPGRSYSKWQKT